MSPSRSKSKPITRLLRMNLRAFVALAVAVSLPSFALDGRVVGIADGDTLTILDGRDTQHKIRVVGIDAPEKKQDFGQKAKVSLSNLVFNQAVTADCRKKDRYKRNLCVVYVHGRDVGLQQVRAGLAWHYKQYAKEQPADERKAYERAEMEAKAARTGLWIDRNPVPPWEWRHKKH